MFQFFKSNLNYTCLEPFWMSRVVVPTYLRGLCQSPQYEVTAVTSHWQREVDLIGLGFELHTSHSRSIRLITWMCSSSYSIFLSC